MNFYLTQVREILRDGNKISVSTEEGLVTGTFEIPKCGLQLKKGDWIIRHSSEPRTFAIDKVISMGDGELRLRRVLGSFEESPSIKRKCGNVRICFR